MWIHARPWKTKTDLKQTRLQIFHNYPLFTRLCAQHLFLLAHAQNKPNLQPPNHGFLPSNLSSSMKQTSYWSLVEIEHAESHSTTQRTKSFPNFIWTPYGFHPINGTRMGSTTSHFYPISQIRIPRTTKGEFISITIPPFRIHFLVSFFHSTLSKITLRKTQPIISLPHQSKSNGLSFSLEASTCDPPTLHRNISGVLLITS